MAFLDKAGVSHLWNHIVNKISSITNEIKTSIPTVDETLAITGAAADAKAVGNALNEKLSIAGGTLTGDLRLNNGTTQTKVSINRVINETGYEIQEYINYQGNAHINLFKGGSQINGIVMSENNTKILKPITLEGGATGDIAAQTRANLGIPDSANIESISADKVTAGTLAGAIKANAEASADLTTAQVRNITVSTTDLEAEVSELAAGEIYVVYE